MRQRGSGNFLWRARLGNGHRSHVGSQRGRKGIILRLRNPLASHSCTLTVPSILTVSGFAPGRA